MSIIDFVFEKEDNKKRIENFNIDRDDIYRVESRTKDNTKKSDHRTIFFDLQWHSLRKDKKEKIEISKKVINPDFEHLNEILSNFKFDSNVDVQTN